jgi:4-diphosphocytidyl-2C-methyl-D-erythritol kinase
MSRIAANDFESVVTITRPDIGTALRELRAVASDGAIAMMSGSGATCFLLNGDVDVPDIPGARLIRTETL